MALLLLLPYRTGEISYMLQYALFTKFDSILGDPFFQQILYIQQ
jgi:hypothetical protein